MGRTLNRASLPRDASGQVDLEAVGAALSALRGSVPSRPTTRVRSAILLTDLEALGGVSTPVVATNGHAVEPTVIAPAEVISRPATMAPPALPVDVAPVRGVQPTDVRGIGRILPAPVNLEDLEGSASMRAPSARPVSDSPVVETSAEETIMVVQDDVELGPIPPLDERPASQPAPDLPMHSSLPAPIEPTPAPPVARPVSAPPAATSPPVPSRRPTQASIPAVMSTRMSYASLLPVNAPSVAPAEVGASFDEFLGSAPVEPTPRPAPPLSIPRAMPSIPGLPRRPTMQVPMVRVPTGLTSGSLPRVPAVTVAPPIVEAVEALDVDEVVEVDEEEVAPAPMLSRPPALPPLPPKKR